MNFGLWRNSLAQDVLGHGALQLVSGLNRPCSVGIFALFTLAARLKTVLLPPCHSRATQKNVQILSLVHFDCCSLTILLD